MQKIKFLTLIAAIITLSISCKKNNVESPVITDFELGIDNSNQGYVGTGTHVEAQVEAEGRIEKIEIHIHPEDAPGSTWEEEIEYTDAQGLRNTTFHEHFDIPADAAEGTYHFHFEVYDQEGNVSEIERDLEVSILNDNIMPVVTVTTPANTDGQTFTTGQTITVEGNISDNIGISGLLVGLVKVSDALDDAAVTYQNSIVLLHTHDFAEPDDVDFTASIVVGAAQDNNPTPQDITWESTEYYLLVKAPNLGGNGAGYSAHYPVTINL
jgi:hypothetical protein